MATDDEYGTCMRNLYFNDHVCQGRLTREHALIYSGRQIDERWAIISICAWAHDVDEWQDAGNLDKDKNVYIALTRAGPEDLAKYPRTDWEQMRRYLKSKFGRIEPITEIATKHKAPF